SIHGKQGGKGDHCREADHQQEHSPKDFLDACLPEDGPVGRSVIHGVLFLRGRAGRDPSRHAASRISSQSGEPSPFFSGGDISRTPEFGNGLSCRSVNEPSAGSKKRARVGPGNAPMSIVTVRWPVK